MIVRRRTKAGRWQYRDTASGKVRSQASWKRSIEARRAVTAKQIRESVRAIKAQQRALKRARERRRAAPLKIEKPSTRGGAGGGGGGFDGIVKGIEDIVKRRVKPLEEENVIEEDVGQWEDYEGNLDYGKG